MAPRGLYAITPDSSSDAALLRQVEAAASGGVKLLQYRNKTADAATRRRQALLLADYCRAQHIALVINDHIALAAECRAGVHLGRGDGSIGAARRALGADALIGSTCGNSLARARAAAAAGASYIALGAFFPSPSKPSAARCALATLQRARRQLALPIVAIGGISAANAAAVIRAGASAIAVCSGLFAQRDIAASARQLRGLFHDER